MLPYILHNSSMPLSKMQHCRGMAYTLFTLMAAGAWLTCFALSRHCTAPAALAGVGGARGEGAQDDTRRRTPDHAARADGGQGHSEEGQASTGGAASSLPVEAPARKVRGRRSVGRRRQRRPQRWRRRRQQRRQRRRQRRGRGDFLNACVRCAVACARLYSVCMLALQCDHSEHSCGARSQAKLMQLWHGREAEQHRSCAVHVYVLPVVCMRGCGRPVSCLVQMNHTYSWCNTASGGHGHHNSCVRVRLLLSCFSLGSLYSSVCVHEVYAQL
jgi:hypothetical protein